MKYEREVETYAMYLRENEKSRSTAEEYISDICGFCVYLGENELNKEDVTISGRIENEVCAIKCKYQAHSRKPVCKVCCQRGL